MRYGVAIHETTVPATLDAIVAAEEEQLPVAWLTSMSLDQMAIFSAAAVRTRRIHLGTAIVPTYPRHPVLLAQQALVVDSLAPGRLELGVGPSHQPNIEGWLGIPFVKPLAHTREYLQVLRQAFTQGKVDFEGEFFRIHMPSVKPVNAPLLVSGLRPAAFRLAGELADGGISWICPARYLREQALPALKEGAEKAGRAVPKLVAHCFLTVSTNDAAVREDARRRLRFYPRMPFYSKMLEAAGDKESAAGEVSDRLIDSVVIHGRASQCAERLQAFATESGAADLIVSLMPGEVPDRPARLREAMQVVAGLNAVTSTELKAR
ncbi:MAG: LLM class flavin-dependent oxidoreductase [Candidatus Xenobia bacterium]